MASGNRRIIVPALALLIGAASAARAADAWQTKHLASCIESTRFDELRNREDILLDGAAGVNDAFLCQALMEKSSSACRNVGAWLKRSLKFSGLSSCEYGYFLLTVAPAAMRKDPQAVGLCMAGASTDSPEQQRRTCQYYVQAISGRQFHGMCEKMAELAGGDFNADGCRTDMLPLEGAEACRELPDAAAKAACRRNATMLKALASRRRTDCGGSTLCEAVLSGRPELCSDVRKDAVERYCREKTATDYRRVMSEEVQFRKVNGLPPYKPGDKLLSDLPGPERMRYEKRNRKPAPKSPASTP